MRSTPLRAFVLLAVAIGVAAAALADSAAAQEGHPLAGTWYGEYEAGGQKHDLTVIMKWDGRAVTGTVNPGPAAKALQTVVLDITPGKPAPQGQDSTTGTPPVFNVRIEMDLPHAAGERAVFAGRIQNPVAGNRQLIGTWTRGNERGAFRLRRL